MQHDHLLRAVGVLQLSVVGGYLQPTWRAVAGEALPTPDILTFEALATQLAEGPVEDPPGLHPSGAEWSLAVKLDVQPAIAAGADCAVFFAGAEPRPQNLLQIAEELRRGLTADRRQQLAAAALAAIETSPDAIELTDHGARLMYVNQAWQEYFGYDSHEVVGKTVGALLRDQADALHDSAFYQFALDSLAEGEPFKAALACLRKNGERVFCEVSVGAFADDEGGLAGNFAIRRDLRDRLERERALAVAHREFRGVLSALPDGVIVTSGGRVAFANPAFLSLVRSEEADVIGRDFRSFIVAADQGRVAHEQGVVGVRIQPKSGPLRYAEVCPAGEVSFGGSPARIIVCRDTTDQRLAQEQLARAERLSALGALAGSMAHEINNPLSYVGLNLTHIELSAGPALEEEERHALSEALDGVKRIRGIVDDLKAFNRHDNTGPPEPVEVEQAVSAALNIANNQIRHRARLERHHEGGLLVLAREGQLVQVVLNLLLNAAQALDSPDVDNQCISITSRDAGGGVVEIVVADSGSGIPPELLSTVFEPFVSTKGGHGGSGLGLPISRRIVRDFGGEITLQSDVGRGTSAIVRLPRTVVAPSARSGVRRSSHQEGPASARILIVDDEPALVRSLRRLLHGHEVVSAADGHSALEILSRDRNFDLVLCDLMMPGLPGPRLYRSVEEQMPELAARFVFMTGGAFTEWGQEFLNSTELPILNKPLDLERVLGVLARATEAATAGDIETSRKQRGGGGGSVQ